MKSFLILLLIVPLLVFSQDPREFNHGTCIVPYQNNNNNIKYYLTWSSAFNNAWEHDIYNATIYFDTNGNLIEDKPNQLFIGTGSDEAQEPVNATINKVNNTILSVWEDGVDLDAPNVRGQLHSPTGAIMRSNWVIAGGTGSQHSANTAHLNNKYLVFYADEAPPSTGGAVLKAKVIDDSTGDERQTISFTPNNEDHWWPVSVSNSDHTRTLIVWGNDGFAVRGTVLFDNAGLIEKKKEVQDYLTNTQQYYYQVEWLENISKFILIARNGAYNDITDSSQICLIDTDGNIISSTTVAGGILREAKMAVKWSQCSQTYHIFYPSGTSNLTQISIDNLGVVSNLSNQIIGHSDLSAIQWTSTGIWSTFITDINGNDLIEDDYIVFFIMNDLLSDNIVKIPVRLDTSLFCDTLTIDESEIDENSLILYPNPTHDIVIIPNKFINSTYEVVSINGQILQQGKVISNKISLLSLNSGMYFIKIIDRESGNQYLFKVFKRS